MLRDKVTVVYATSPHRFGDSTAMIDLSIATTKEFGFKDCRFIICADAPNPNSRHAEQKESDLYESYLKKLQKKYPEFELLCSKEHIGLTLNYRQAWDQGKIKTDFVFLMNHDVAIIPAFKNISVEDVVDEFPQEGKVLCFSRSDNMFWQRWFNPQHFNAPKSWRAKRAFGFQDNACIMRAPAYIEYIKEFYKPNITKFIEDSIQEEMKRTDMKDDKIGAYVWDKPLSFHLDGQSKADNGSPAEEVWSKGVCRARDVRDIKELEKKAGKSLGKVVDNFLTEEKAFQGRKIITLHNKLSENLINYCRLNLSKNETLSPNIKAPLTNINVGPPLPLQDEKFNEKICLKAGSINFYWKQNKKENILLKLTRDGQQLCYGGHGVGSATVNLSERETRRAKSLNFQLIRFKNSRREKAFKEKLLNLQFCQFNDKQARFSWGGSDETYDLALFKGKKEISHSNDGNVLIDFAKENILAGEELRGFFKLKGTGKKTWDFSIQAPYLNIYSKDAEEKVSAIIKNIHSVIEALIPERGQK